MKHPPDPVLEAIYIELKQRKLAKSHADFMRRFVPGLTNAVWHKRRASLMTLTRLWTSLNEHAQHDLAIVAHKALLASAVAQSPQPSQGVA
jgi:hypothetical protein